MQIPVIRPTGKWSTTSFVDLAEIAGGRRADPRSTAAVPRGCDWDGDGLLDLLVGAEGGVWFRNAGTPPGPRFAAGVAVEAGGKEISHSARAVSHRLAGHGPRRPARSAVIADDRKVRWSRNVARLAGEPVLARRSS